MKIIRSIMGFAVVAALLSGCTTTEQATKDISMAWVGKPIDQFFFDHGLPIAVYESGEGVKLYQWSSGVEEYTSMSTSTTTYSGNMYGNSLYGNANTSSFGGGAYKLECRAQITTKNGVITALKLKDTIGLWRLSRCDEVLNK